jgi:hypothetical protein
MAKKKNRHSASRKRFLKKRLGGNNQKNANIGQKEPAI